jgi:hypothetical protein
VTDKLRDLRVPVEEGWKNCGTFKKTKGGSLFVEKKHFSGRKVRRPNEASR